MKRLVMAALGMLFGVGIMLSSANAAPVSRDWKDISGPSTLIEQVHGCHRHCEPGRYGPHRHVGPYCERVPCGDYGRRPRCVKDYHCVKTDPLGIGKRCYWRELCR
jgi:hypothetical protein